ncbi:MAG: hypothetical protein EU539_01225 [Promethearchaeota archaeon]|nr:MAG: hypothetical protein EU539_01225 [Candidatus Lokiarchaeota archaeon]
MSRGDSYKIVVIFGGLLGIFAVLSYYLSESLGAWWQATFEIWRFERNYYINAFGYSEDDQILGNLGLFAGVLFLLGSFIAIITAGKKSKNLGIISFLIMIAGIGLFLYALSEWENFGRFLNILEFISGEEQNVFYGSAGNLTWGLGVGFFLAVIATIIVLIGSIKMD